MKKDPDKPAYSGRIAASGSIFVARRAGREQAHSATPASSNATRMKVSGSAGLTSKSKLAIQRVIGPGRVVLGGTLAGVAAGAILLASLHGRVEGWKISIGVLTAFALYSVVR